jgi:predicted tellurium resistance membrane protein TerC
VVMLLGATWIMQLTKPFISLFDFDLSVKDLLLLGGGLFLIAKSTFEMHADIAGKDEKKEIVGKSSFTGAVFQIIAIDFVFSFDSIITAVGMSPRLPVIVAAIVVAMIMMVVASGYISHFLEKYPAFKVLALSFILMIGTMLMAEGLHFHMPRGYIYFAFFFSIFVEILNTYASKKRKAQKSSGDVA